jgi:cyclase
MPKMRVIPVILLKNNNIVQSKNFSEYKIVGDPFAIIDRLSSWNADEVIYLNITSNQKESLNRIDLKVKYNVSFLEIIKKMSKQCFMPLTVGGGIKTVNDAYKFFASGADKICINSCSYNYKLIKDLAKRFGSQAIVVSIDVKKIKKNWCIYLNGGQYKYNLDLNDHIKFCQDNGAGEIIINSIDRDGSYKGYDLELLEYVLKFANIPVIALGGVGDWQHMHDCIKKLNISAVAAGNIFHHSENSYYNSISFLKKRGIDVRNPALNELKNIYYK